VPSHSAKKNLPHSKYKNTRKKAVDTLELKFESFTFFSFVSLLFFEVVFAFFVNDLSFFFLSSRLPKRCYLKHSIQNVVLHTYLRLIARFQLNLLFLFQRNCRRRNISFVILINLLLFLTSGGGCDTYDANLVLRGTFLGCTQ
jgi:hypothetical protein